MAHRRKTPQQKKQDTYERDRRNVYGERGSHSRHAVSRAKQARSGRTRAAVRQAVDAVTRDPELAERLEGRATVRTGGRWQKIPDEPLGAVLERKLEYRTKAGSLPTAVAEKKSAKIRGRT